LIQDNLICNVIFCLYYFPVPATPPPSPQSWACGTLKGLEQSMIPELVRYARETDSSIAIARQDNRRRLFAVCPYLPVCIPTLLKSTCHNGRVFTLCNYINVSQYIRY
jgi:hypothetical protein